MLASFKVSFVELGVCCGNEGCQNESLDCTFKYCLQILSVWSFDIAAKAPYWQ